MIRPVRLYGYTFPAQGMFPLAVDASGRYLKAASGAQFFIHGDAIWSLCVGATRAQIDTYLNDRQARGVTAILINLIEHKYNFSPPYRNAEGNDPFTSMSGAGPYAGAFGTPNESYWQLVDYIVNGCKSRGILVLAFPAYWGFTTGSGASDQGWDQELMSANTSDLQAYGAFLANRYTQGNILWMKGGDNDMGAGNRALQENITTGIQSVRTTDHFSAHVAIEDDSYPLWNGTSGYDINTIYTYLGYSQTLGAQAYARSPALPFFSVEAVYEGDTNDGWSLSLGRRQHWTAWLSGGIGDIFGCLPLWDLGDPNFGGSIGAAAALSGYLNSPGRIQRDYMTSFVNARNWWLLQPKTDMTLVTSALGSGTTGVVPALASDGSFAVVWKNDTSSITINMAALNSSKLVRWFDPSNGTYSTVGTFSNSGSQVFTHPGANAAGDNDRVLVIE